MSKNSVVNSTEPAAAADRLANLRGRNWAASNHGFDFVRAARDELFGDDLPKVSLPKNPTMAQARLAFGGALAPFGWRPVPGPVDGGAVVFERDGTPWAGLYVDGTVIFVDRKDALVEATLKEISSGGSRWYARG